MAPLVAVKAQPRIEYRVGMHSPGLTTYPIWAQWLIRFVYFITGYQVTPHDVGIAETEDEADEWCLNESYFYKPLYVGQPLPPEASGPGPVVWPRLNDKTRKLYAQHSPDLVTLTRSQFNLLQAEVSNTLAKAAKAK